MSITQFNKEEEEEENDLKEDCLLESYRKKEKTQLQIVNDKERRNSLRYRSEKKREQNQNSK